MKCTLAALPRRYVALGAIEVPSVCIVDEISLCTTQDFQWTTRCWSCASPAAHFG